MSRPTARLALLLRSGLILLGLLFPAACGIVGNDTERDARLTYCLSPDQRSALIDTAAVLGLADRGDGPDRLVVAGGETTLEAWRKSRPDDFDRSCEALTESARIRSGPPAGDELNSTLNVLLPVVIGAILAWLTGEWRAKAVTARLEADTLRSAARGYANVCNAYIRDWTGPAGQGRPDAEPVRARRDDLDAQLRRAGVLHPRWRAPKALRGSLTELTRHTLREDLADTLPRGWVDLTADERQHYALVLRSELDQFDASAEQVAEALERPWRMHRSMRKIPAPAVPPPLPAPKNSESTQ